MMNNKYSFLSQDMGYITMRQNVIVNKMIPYRRDVDHRLVQFLRELYYTKINNIKPCVPIYMKYGIKREDYDQILYYIKKYNIKPFLYDCQDYNN